MQGPGHPAPAGRPDWQAVHKGVPARGLLARGGVRLKLDVPGAGPMATDPLDALRLTLMQDVLPVGLAVVKRAQRGGPSEVMAAFDGSASDPLGRLREEGEPAASQQIGRAHV